MLRTQQVTLHLELDASDTIRGSVVVGDGRSRPFDGWLELSAVLDEARQIGADGASGEGGVEDGR